MTPHGVQSDASGNIYVTGYFGTVNTTGTNAVQATVDFDPGPGIATQTNSGERDPFIAKYDPNGNHLWARTLGNTTYANTNLEERAWDMAVDASGSVYAVGMVLALGVRPLSQETCVAVNPKELNAMAPPWRKHSGWCRSFSSSAEMRAKDFLPLKLG